MADAKPPCCMDVETMGGDHHHHQIVRMANNNLEPIRFLSETQPRKWHKLEIMMPEFPKIEDRVGHTLVTVPKRDAVFMLGITSSSLLKCHFCLKKPKWFDYFN